MLQRLARFCYRRRWRVLGGWVVLLVGLFALNSTFGGKFLDEFDLPGSESQEAVDLMEEHGFDTRAGATGQVVFKADDVNDPTVRREIEVVFNRIAEITAPSEVVSPYSGEGAHRVVEVQQPFVPALHHQHRGERLRHRPHPEQSAVIQRQVLPRGPDLECPQRTVGPVHRHR